MVLGRRFRVRGGYLRYELIDLPSDMTLGEVERLVCVPYTVLEVKEDKGYRGDGK